jgi:hypothetical protein
MRRAIAYEGVDYPTQWKMAEQLAEITGYTPGTCKQLLYRFGKDPQRVIEHAAKWAEYEEKKKITITYAGVVYPTQKALAEHLGKITGRAPGTCKQLLHRFGNDPQRVIEYAATTCMRLKVTIGDRTFPSYGAFGRHLQANYGVHFHTAVNWLSHDHLTPEQCLEHARAYRKRRRKSPERDGEMVLFGWHFRSPAGLCRYYQINPDKFRVEWRSRAAGTPVHMMPSCMRALAVLWELGRLDERNRHPPEVEARLPPTCLPRNEVLDENALTAYEHRHLDCLQSPEAVTERRTGLAWLARARQQATRTP